MQRKITNIFKPSSINNYLVVFILMLTAFNGKAQFGNENLISPSHVWPRDAKSFDLDGDGDLDVLVASLFDDKIAWYENIGGGNFTSQQIITTSAISVVDIYAADLDMDGDLDVLSASYSGVSWNQNLGQGNFASIQTLSSSGSVSSVYTSDINNDGDLDIVASVGNDIIWLENYGAGSFSTENYLPTSLSLVMMVLTADFDGDGLEDIVSCSNGSGGIVGSGKVAWHKNLGAGTFAAQQELSINFYGAGTIHVTDIDNDGDQDIIASAPFFSTVVWFENLAGGIFSGQQVVSNSSVPGIGTVYSGDIDGDGLKDIISASTTNDRVGWYRNLGAGTFDPFVIISTAGDSPYSLYADDINGDGDLDLLVASYYDEKISYLENLGLGVFDAEKVIAITTNSPTTLNVRDMDGDGDLDILSNSTATSPAISSSSGSDSSRIVYFENLGTEFGPQQTIDKDIAFPKSQITEDLDGDGDYELILATWNTDKIIWYDNLGGMNFGPQQIISTAVDDPLSVFAIDLDGDSDADILSASYNDDKIAWYENLGTGSFGPQQIISTNADGASFVISADLDNDGDNDVISASNLDDKIAWYENNGSGTFGAAQVVTTGLAGARCVHAADLNQDGFIDLISTSSVTSELAWYENLGGVSFGPEQIISTAVIGAYSVSSGDIDGDGDIDLASAASNSDQVFWHENLGLGLSWGDYIVSSNTENVRNVIIVDMDQDGSKDIISASIDDAKITWFGSYFNSAYQLKGQMFYDANQNAVRDTLEGSLSFVETSIQGAYINSYTSVTGNYLYALDTGAYTVNYSVPNALWTITTDSLSYTRTLSNVNPLEDSLDFGFYPDSIVTIISPNITGGLPRCNTDVNYWLSIENVGTTIPNGIVHLELDNALNFVSSIVTPDSIIGQNIYWHFDSLFYYSSDYFNVEVATPNFMSAGLGLTSVLNVYVHNANDSIIYTNSETLSQTVVCAYDPNDKSVQPAGLGAEGFIEPDQELEYLVRFQNTGSDTAITVLIVDDLDVNLDWNTFQPISSSHPVEITFDNGQIKFKFENIMLPDSTTNFLGSQGFTKFSIRPLAGLVHGEELHNTAGIFFDYNPAVITNTVLNTVYICDSLSLDFNTNNICLGSHLLLDSPPSTIENYSWQLDSFYSDSSSFFDWQADTSGTFALSMVAIGPLCTFDTILNISVLAEAPMGLVNQQICQGDSILIYGEYQSISGNYYDTIQTIYGCDSVTSTSLSINSITYANETQSLCYGDSILIYGSYQSNSGTYNNTITSINGCDSIVESTTLNLIPPSAFSSDTQTICQGDSILIFGQYEFTTGVFGDTIQSVFGCDSVLSFQLNVNPVNVSTETLTICQGDSILVNGSHVSGAGIYSDTLQSFNGCDSILTTEVLVNSAIDVTITDNSPTLTANLNAAMYQWVDCADNYSPINGENSQVFTTQQNGDYGVIITKNGCSDTSACILVENVSLKHHQNFEDILIYPNPNFGIIHLEFNSAQDFHVRIHDLNGKVVYEEWDIYSKNHQVELIVDSGIYFIEIIIEGYSQTFKIVKD